VLALEVRYGLLLLSEQYNAWRWLGWAILPSLYLVLMAAPRAWPWPVSAHSREYRVYAAAPLALLMLGWFWLANTFSDGSAEPLPYVPLLNPLELGLLFALFGVYAWARSAVAQLAIRWGHAGHVAQLIAGVSLFAFFTAVVMRSAHHWIGVPFELDALLESMFVQAGLSIVWTLIALGLMIGGHLRHRREVWLIGAALIAVVVAKLFFVELSNRGGLARMGGLVGDGPGTAGGLCPSGAIGLERRGTLVSPGVAPGDSVASAPDRSERPAGVQRRRAGPGLRIGSRDGPEPGKQHHRREVVPVVQRRR
jgi:uncharacterized membrane protein